MQDPGNDPVGGQDGLTQDQLDAVLKAAKEGKLIFTTQPAVDGEKYDFTPGKIDFATQIHAENVTPAQLLGMNVLINKDGVATEKNLIEAIYDLSQDDSSFDIEEFHKIQDDILNLEGGESTDPVYDRDPAVAEWLDGIEVPSFPTKPERPEGDLIHISSPTDGSGYQDDADGSIKGSTKFFPLVEGRDDDDNVVWDLFYFVYANMISNGVTVANSEANMSEYTFSIAPLYKSKIKFEGHGGSYREYIKVLEAFKTEQTTICAELDTLLATYTKEYTDLDPILQSSKAEKEAEKTSKETSLKERKEAYKTAKADYDAAIAVGNVTEANVKREAYLKIAKEIAVLEAEIAQLTIDLAGISDDLASIVIIFDDQKRALDIAREKCQSILNDLNDEITAINDLTEAAVKENEKNKDEYNKASKIYGASNGNDDNRA